MRKGESWFGERERGVGLRESCMGWDCLQKPIQNWLALRTVVNICNFTHRGCLEIVMAM